MRGKIVVYILLFIMIAFFNLPLWAQEAKTEDLKIMGFTPGLIFNTSNILLDLSAYQTGVGIMLWKSDHSLRTLFHMGYESGNEIFDTKLGIAYIKPVFQGRIVPYWGAELKGGYNIDTDQLNNENIQKTTVLTGGLAGILGTEVYILDFLSAFAEYNLGIFFSRSTVEQDTEGFEAQPATTNYRIGTELGNEGSIGVVVYLEKRPLSEGFINK